MTGDGLAHMEDRGNIGLQQPLKSIGWKIVQLGAMLHAGIVDQNVNRANLSLKAIDSTPHSFVICCIKGQGMHGCAFIAQLLPRGLELRCIAPVEDKVRPCPGQSSSQGKTNALAGSGD